MAKRYQIQSPWPNFLLDDETFDLSHLDEYQLSAQDSEGHVREILVTFSDHCFTRDRNESDPEKLIYPMSTRRPGCFSRSRYTHSLLLVRHIEAAKTGSVWNVEGQNLAIIPIITHDGAYAHYAIIFDIRTVSGRPPFHLHMEVRTAFPCDASKELVTHGEVGFKRLISIRMAGRHLNKNTSRHRRRPRPLGP